MPSSVLPIVFDIVALGFVEEPCEPSGGCSVTLPTVMLAYRTISLPSMTGCSLQKYGSSPLSNATY